VLIERIDKSRSVWRTVVCDPAEDSDKVINRNRKVTEGVLICHATVAEVFL
jgi:hypothetical protein